MAGLKRKDAPASRMQADSSYKKPKKETPHSKKNPTIQILETETDSDPIIESDTTEHSGEDDGVSWPSDEDEKAFEASPGKKEDRAEKLPKTLEGEAKPTKQSVSGSNPDTGEIA